MNMWSPQQRNALDRVGQWLKTRDKPTFQLAGFAGTGKTTLAKHLASTVNGPVYFAAYTGKAAHVLTKSGATNVSTIHKLIYTPKDKSQQRLKDLQAERARLLTHDPVPTTLVEKVEAAITAEKTNLARPMFQLNTESPLFEAALLVVDEYSMIDEQMGADLLSFGCPILALGDPGQLPPVGGTPFFKGKPDILLTEIHRQAQDNPIIWMSKEVREGRALRPGDYGNSRVIPYGLLPREELRDIVLSTDQLLVGRNATRISSNSRARELLGRANALPQEGDKLVCLRNNHEVGLLNGQLWKARRDSVFDGDYVIMDIEGEDGVKIEVSAHPHYFHGNKPEYWERKDAEEFDYGYALTVHKSQGSQWNNVLLFDEWYGKDRKEWLYTAITRAAERIDIVVM
jgi:exodeoxyribonuclease-5